MLNVGQLDAARIDFSSCYTTTATAPAPAAITASTVVLIVLVPSNPILPRHSARRPLDADRGDRLRRHLPLVRRLPHQRGGRPQAPARRALPDDGHVPRVAAVRQVGVHVGPELAAAAVVAARERGGRLDGAQRLQATRAGGGGAVPQAQAPEHLAGDQDVQRGVLDLVRSAR